MTREEAIKTLRGEAWICCQEKWVEALEMAIQALSQEPKYCDRNICIKNEYNGIGCDECEVTKSQEPCGDIAQERYKDLCEYFGGAKDILKSREDFKAWLGRVKWHIRKAEELYEKYEYKKEPCEDAISRKALLDGIEELKKSPWATDKRGNGFEYLITEALDVVKDLCIKQAPSVTQKSETVTEFADRCRECGAKYGKLLEQKSGKWMLNKEKSLFFDIYECSNCGKIGVLTNYCPNCGARMVEPQESEDKE